MMDDRAASPIWSDSDLALAFVKARSAWPNVHLSIEDFAGFLSGHGVIPQETPEPILADLFLACACARNVSGALLSFRERFFSVVALAVSRFDDSPAFVDEVYQRLSEILFVNGPTGRGRIAQYEGQGGLTGFVSTAARRIALRLTIHSARFQGEEALIQQFAQIHEHETAMLKSRHRETFNRALAVALRQLPRRERLILRLNLVERVSTSRIADMYKVSQPTVSRWIQRSAREIFSTVKDLVCDELDIDTRELESLLLLVRSQIEITMSKTTDDSTTLVR